MLILANRNKNGDPFPDRRRCLVAGVGYRIYRHKPEFIRVENFLLALRPRTSRPSAAQSRLRLWQQEGELASGARNHLELPIRRRVRDAGSPRLITVILAVEE